MKTSSKNSPFAKVLDAWPEARLREAIDRAGPGDVKRALGREQLFPEDLAALLSPAAAPFLEDMAQAAHRLTRQHFGRTIGLYAPIYLSNICHSDCLYCGYALYSGSVGDRRTLTMDEIRAECAVLAGHGFQSVLLLTGEAPKAAPVEYLAQGVAIAREYFASVAVEVYALDEADYRRLVERGLEGVTLYMETYHRETYAQVHRRGRKRDYEYRLEAMARAGRAGCGGSASGRSWASTTGGPTASGWACTPASSRKNAGRAPFPFPSRGCGTPRSALRCSICPPTGNWCS